MRAGENNRGAGANIVSVDASTAVSLDAEQITKASKSNLALAFVALPRDRRRDMAIFYSFCRLVDDLADESTASVQERQRSLDIWKASLSGEVDGESPLAEQVRDLIARRNLKAENFIEIILGCEMDLCGTIYETWDDLRLYCHRVASCVGLVSLGIFGARSPAAIQYAKDLGLAFQVTNIVRDVAHDFREMGRIYLPREEMVRFGYTREALAAECWNDAFRALMNFQADRAEAFYQRALDAYPRSDRRALVAAEIMRRVYYRLLQKMRHDQFRVFDRKYRLGRFEKLSCILRGFLSSL
jgi:phytoene synthase